MLHNAEDSCRTPVKQTWLKELKLMGSQLCELDGVECRRAGAEDGTYGDVGGLVRGRPARRRFKKGALEYAIAESLCVLAVAIPSHSPCPL